MPEQLRLSLPFRAPLHAPSLFGHLAATAVPGVERWVDGALERTLRLPHGAGLVRLHAPLTEGATPTGRAPAPTGRALAPAEDASAPAEDASAPQVITADLWLQDPRDQQMAADKCRTLLDLDSDPVAVDGVLSQDAALTPATLARPGVRIPGAMDPAEFALRAVLGQQVSTAAAATTTGRIVHEFGELLPPSLVRRPGQPDRLFPSPTTLAALAPDDPRLPGMPATRRRTLLAVATALADGSLDLRPEVPRPTQRAQLDAIPGVGPWTREIIMMRGLGDPDAFPATDLGVLRGAEALGLDVGPRALERHAESWRPWRSYAVQTFWAATAHPAAQLPPTRQEAIT